MSVLVATGLGLLVGLVVGAVATISVAGPSRGHRGPRHPAEPATDELAAMRLRVQVADALAEQERQRAQQTGAGTAALLAGLLAAEEGARGQLAAELHDTVAQSLLLARSRLGGRDERRGLSGPEAEHVEQLVTETEEQLRGVIARTRPPALRDGDLGSAVSLLCEDFTRRYGLQVEVSWPPAPTPLPMTVAVPLYRFFAEALLNVVKHADDDCAQLRLQVAGGQVLAEVADTGPGFTPAAVRPRGGRQVGLDLLGARVALAGGRLDVRSAPGAGTTVALCLPVDIGVAIGGDGSVSDAGAGATGRPLGSTVPM